MKKNRMMRVASILLVAVLLTTSAISGTFAKYVTSDSVSDSARVAKWGVTVTTTGSLFEHQYSYASDSTKSSVIRVDAGDVVAPGTSNTDGLTFTITGSPEVAVNITSAATSTANVELPIGYYADYTTGAVDEFHQETAYYPIKFTLTHTAQGSSTVTTVVDGGTLEAVLTALNFNVNCEPNSSLGAKSGTYHLTWAWAFDPNGEGTFDKPDTLLGQVANGMPAGMPGTTNTPTPTPSTEVNFSIVITVTQID